MVDKDETKVGVTKDTKASSPDPSQPDQKAVVLPLLTFDQALIANISIRSTKEEVISKLGQPEKVVNYPYHKGLKEVSGDEVPYEEWLYQGLTLQLMLDKVIWVESSSNRYRTSFGVQVGDPASSIDNPNLFIRIETKNDKVTLITLFEPIE